MPQVKPSHASVLQKEVLELLMDGKVRTVFDGTLGLGGHANAILEQYPNVMLYIGCDLDQEHLQHAKERLGGWGDRIQFVHTNFSAVGEVLEQLDPGRPLVIFLDLGLCSNHLDKSEKGFAFAACGPLRMTFDETQQEDAAVLLNTVSERELARILKEYGEEPLARKIARRIVETREERILETTDDLREIVEACVYPQDRKKTLTRVFQAVRIAVNDELAHLKTALHGALEVMQEGDRIGVISYHSLEDRLVKQCFKEAAKPKTEETEFSLHTPVAPARFRLSPKKAVMPSYEEIEQNPRARSARFRIAECIA